MMVVEFDGKQALIAEAKDFQTEVDDNLPGIPKYLDAIFVSKDYMLMFRDTPLFKSLFSRITDKTRFVYV